MLHHSMEALMDHRGIIIGEPTPPFYCTVSRSRHDAKATEAEIISILLKSWVWQAL
jgi:hypothetical protein